MQYDPLPDFTEHDIRIAMKFTGGNREKALKKLHGEKAYVQALRDGKTKAEAREAELAATK